MIKSILALKGLEGRPLELDITFVIKGMFLPTISSGGRGKLVEVIWGIGLWAKIWENKRIFMNSLIAVQESFCEGWHRINKARIKDFLLIGEAKIWA